MLFGQVASVHGNPSSRSHSFGTRARRAVEDARILVAASLDVGPENLVFTSGATESIGIISACLPFSEVSGTSHKAMLSRVSLNARVEQKSSHLGIDLVNNETGIIHHARECKSLLTSDATQAFGKVSSDFWKHSDFALGSAHKFHGPLGVGLLVARDVDLWDCLVLPGNEGAQERGVRPGTLNVPAIIQTGEVARWMLKNGDEYRAKLKHLQSAFESKIKSLTDCWVIGSDQERAPHITSLNLPGVDNEALIASVNDRLAIASGSACTSEKVEPSHVLMAMFNDREIADTTVRISYGWFNTETEVLEAAEIIAKAAETIRSFSL